jgi:Tol biopolymer transport system component
VTRLSVTLPEGKRLLNDLSPSFAIRPDGRQVVFSGRESNRSDSRIYVRDLGTFETERLEGTTDARQPVLSPDGQSVAFVTFRPAIYRISRNGGAAVKLCETAGRLRGLAWTDRGQILFGTDTTGILSVSENGGNPEPVTTLAPDETSHWNPNPLPQNRGLLFTVLRRGAGANTDVAVLSSTASEHQVLFHGQGAAYVSSGHLVFGRAGSTALFAVAFDLASLEVRGPPVQLQATLALNANLNPQFRLGENGTLVYSPGDDSKSTVVWVDRQGVAELAATSDRRYHTVHLSMDGKSFAADESGSSEHIWIHDLERGTRVLAATGAYLQTPRFKPDAGVLAYSDSERILVKAIDGTGDARPILVRERTEPSEPSWSRDGTLLAFTEVHPDTGEDLWILPLGVSPRPFLATPARENAPAFSPDGKWIAYQSDDSGRPEIYVQRYPGPGTRALISTNGGKEPVWSRDGRELFYREDTALMAVRVETTDTLRAALPERLFDGPYVADNTGHASYDVSPDGKFLMIRNEGGGLTELRVVLNFAEELKALVPLK